MLRAERKAWKFSERRARERESCSVRDSEAGSRETERVAETGGGDEAPQALQMTGP